MQSCGRVRFDNCDNLGASINIEHQKSEPFGAFINIEHTKSEPLGAPEGVFAGRFRQPHIVPAFPLAYAGAMID